MLGSLQPNADVQQAVQQDFVQHDLSWPSAFAVGNKVKTLQLEVQNTHPQRSSLPDDKTPKACPWNVGMSTAGGSGVT